MKRALCVWLAAGFLVCWYAAGYAWQWQRLHEEADKKDVAAALTKTKLDSGSLQDLYVLGLAYLNQHRDKEAGALFSRIITAEPGNLEARWGLAEVARRQHKLKESEEQLKAIIRADPAFSPAYISLAYLQYIKAEFEAATVSAYKVIKQGRSKVDLSNFTRAYLIYGGAKGMVAQYGGPLSKAINGPAIYPSLKKAESLQSNSPAVFFGLGSFYLLAPSLIGGDMDRAGMYLEKAVKVDPLFVDAYVRLAQWYKIKGDNQKYQEYLEKALAIDPQSEVALDIKSGRCRFICPAKAGR
ncbi:MAG TPA: TRAP transporter TatT component family protein [Patescibacteria group bacterium]|nr:TRAP transporter TatT component family protein [Patescibacteria group bacterium]